MTKAPIFTVEFVYQDEATPRGLHTRTVRAVDAAEAEMFVVMGAAMIGDRVMTTGVYETSYPNRSERDSYYDRRFAYYRAMGDDYSTAADTAAQERDTRYPSYY